MKRKAPSRRAFVATVRCAAFAVLAAGCWPPPDVPPTDPPGEDCGGLLGLPCDRGEFCNFPLDALCGAADATGVCESVPDACDTQYDPVCGCDDVTYSNACTAHAAGVSVAKEGECAPSTP